MTSVGRFGADRDLDLVPSSRYLYALVGQAGGGAYSWMIFPSLSAVK